MWLSLLHPRDLDLGDHQAKWGHRAIQSREGHQRRPQGLSEPSRGTGQAEIEAQEVGMAILAPLRELDEVAYLRYASVYRNFSSLDDFEGEIALLRAMPSNSSSEISSRTSSATLPSKYNASPSDLSPRIKTT